MPFDLSGIAGLQQGAIQGQDAVQRQQYNAILRQLAQQQLLSAQQTQQAQGLAGSAFGNLPQAQQQPMPDQQSMALQSSGAPSQTAAGPGQTGRMSWFGNKPGDAVVPGGWPDRMDSGLQANGQPVSAGPGIALPNRGTLGQQFDVTFPNGKTITAPQTDIGPAAKTGRTVDINAPLAQEAGYTPKTFPTDALATVRAHQQLDKSLDQKGLGMIDQGIPGPVVQDSTKAAMNAGREISPQAWGRSSLQDIITAINKTDPSAPGVVKFLAAAQMSHLMAPEDKMMMQAQFQLNHANLQRELAEFRAGESEHRLQETLLAQGSRQERGIQAAGDRQQARIYAQLQKNPENLVIMKYLEQHPDATAEDIQALRATGRAGARSPAAAAMQKHIQEHPDESDEDRLNYAGQIAATITGKRAFATGQQGNTVRSLGVAVDHLDTFREAGEALKNNKMQIFNSIMQEYAKQTGDPAPTNFDGVKALVRSELIKAVQGSAGALGDREEVEKSVSRASSPEQLVGVIDQWQKLMAGQLRGLKQQFTSNKIGSEGEFDEKVSPRARNVLGKLSGRGESGGSAGAAGGTDWSKMSDEELIKRAREQQ
jgi:hypothetical protein